MAANRKTAGGTRRKRARAGTGLWKFLSYLGVAALGAVAALAATGRVPLPDWPMALVAQVEQIARGEDSARATSPKASTEPRTRATPDRSQAERTRAERPRAERTAAAQRPDSSILTSALPVPRPQRPVPEARPDARPDARSLPAVARPPADVARVPERPGTAGRTTRHSGLTFPICGEGPSRNCVIDGDTFVLAGKAIRVADIDTPESGNPKCRREAELARRATKRLQQLLNAGPLELVAEAREEDIYGRKLRTVTRAGRSLGDTLIAEGLARRWTGAKQSWCA